MDVIRNIYSLLISGGSIDRRNPSPPPPAPAPHRESRNFQQSSNNQTPGGVEATIKDIRMTLQRTKTLPLRPSCVTNGDNDDRESCNSNKSETPIWVPRYVFKILKLLRNCSIEIRLSHFKKIFSYRKY